jgi:RNA-binding protein 25
MLLNELALKGGIIQIAPAPEKPHTTVYVGKISSTVEDECLRAILELCGGIKSWKRAQDPTTGTPKGFGFCEFESAEGVLRALRLLNKYSLEGQELVIDWLRPVLREAGYGASCMSFAHRLRFFK